MRISIKWWASALFGLATLVLTAGSAIADESASRTFDVPPAATSKCPESISKPYPWIACRTTALGTQVIAGPAGDDTWENSRITPGRHPFVNGIGYFGPDANR